jgi:UDP-N-acetylmuramoylalanine-D-glutamate ligase
VRPSSSWASTRPVTARGSRSRPAASRLCRAGSRLWASSPASSSSTTPCPRTCVDAFGEQPLALIVGGFDRGIDYRELASALAARAHPALVVGIPDNGAHIAELARAVGVEAVVAESVDGATRAGFEWLRQRGLTGVVLLSPAAASFGRFGNYRERAAAFTSAVETLRARYGHPQD